MSFDYYYGEQSESFRFLRVSRLLFTAPQFRGLSTDAKLRYSLMLDRMCLSARNDWYDGQGRIFIHYTVTDITEYLNCKKDKVLKLLNVMDNKKGVGLIERVRQGQGKPSKIYVRQFTSQGCPDPPHHSIGSRSQDCTEAEVLTAQNNTAASRKTGSQEYGKTECNYTNKNYAELIKSYPFIYPSRNGFTAGQSVIRPAKSSHTTNSDALRRRCPRKYRICATNAACQGYTPGNLTHSSGALPRARRISHRPSTVKAGRLLRNRPRAVPSRGGGRTSGGINGHQGITLASRAARTSSGRSIKSSRGA